MDPTRDRVLRPLGAREFAPTRSPSQEALAVWRAKNRLKGNASTGQG
jgi:hypothetical protein